MVVTVGDNGRWGAPAAHSLKESGKDWEEQHAMDRARAQTTGQAPIGEDRDENR